MFNLSELCEDVRRTCTCGWRVGHDSRCKATPLYLKQLKAEELQVEISAFFEDLDSYVEGMITNQTTDHYVDTTTWKMETRLLQLLMHE